jgi:2-oxoglutarate ferredoxin oxidoreductase subunit alpha
MNMGQISREVNRVNSSTCRVVKHNRFDGQLITPEELVPRIVDMTS